MIVEGLRHNMPGIVPCTGCCSCCWLQLQDVQGILAGNVCRKRNNADG